MSISASGGDANAGSGGYGGDGGAGGAGGSASNSSSISIENVLIINGDTAQYGSYSLGTNGKKLNITVDEDGNTLVNGKKLDEEELEDGTKVLIFRNSETKYS